MATKKYPNLKGTIFIISYGRSGSTLLQSFLQSIEGAHITGENFGALEGLYLAADRAERSKAVWGKKQHPPNHPWFGASEINPRRVERRLTRVFIEEFIQPPQSARWIGFKEIRHPFLGGQLEPFLKFCLRNFDNPQFVFNSRQVQDVAKSKWWGKKPFEDVKSLVKAADTRFAEYANTYPEHSIQVRHEKSVSNPESLKPLFDKLGEPFNLEAIKGILDQKLVH